MTNKLIRKFKAKTPVFFKRLQRFCIAMSAVSMLALGVKENLPEYMQIVLPHMITLGLIGSLLSQFTEEKPKENL